VGTISRDIGVKFTPTTWYLTTHKIDPNLDDARDYLLADLIEIQKSSRFGFIKNVALEKSTDPKKNLTGDPYFTDNKILVIELSSEDTVPTVFPWHSPLIDKA
ncbi:MAG TPA: LssY C-terminal domain-containing protein, partial [Candidatus Omnitrophota bacterium]|nr:LssY C-terminal domain-containing protein [Candidatus Omnitrophota bacterium]